MKKLNKEKKCLLILLGFILVVLAIFIPVSIVFHMWGLTIGWIIGGVITLASQFLLFKSGKIVGTQAMETGKGTALVILFYASRFLLYAAGLIICALFHWKFKNQYFQWSIFTCIAVLLPSTLIITIFYHDDESDTKKEIKTK